MQAVLFFLELSLLQEHLGIFELYGCVDLFVNIIELPSDIVVSTLGGSHKSSSARRALSGFLELLGVFCGFAVGRPKQSLSKDKQHKAATESHTLSA